jgi:hypothetical protein
LTIFPRENDQKEDCEAKKMTIRQGIRKQGENSIIRKLLLAWFSYTMTSSWDRYWFMLECALEEKKWQQWGNVRAMMRMNTMMKYSSAQ